MRDKMETEEWEKSVVEGMRGKIGKGSSLVSSALAL
jgi:hypothetical protein